MKNFLSLNSKRMIGVFAITLIILFILLLLINDLSIKPALTLKVSPNYALKNESLGLEITFSNYLYKFISIEKAEIEFKQYSMITIDKYVCLRGPIGGIIKGTRSNIAFKEIDEVRGFKLKDNTLFKNKLVIFFTLNESQKKLSNKSDYSYTLKIKYNILGLKKEAEFYIPQEK